MKQRMVCHVSSHFILKYSERLCNAQDCLQDDLDDCEGAWDGSESAANALMNERFASALQAGECVVDGCKLVSTVLILLQ